MNYRLEVVYTRTEDELKLQGMHYAPSKKDIGAVFVHGMSGNFIENAFADVMGKTLAQKGIGYIYGHNRGYGMINDIVRGNPKPTGDNESSRNGAWYESFKQSPKDVDAWVLKAKKLGYKQIILLGHSLGCIKIIYWWGRTKQKSKIKAVGLCSPADMVGPTIGQFKPRVWEKLIKEANTKTAQGKYSDILSQTIDNGWYSISAATFLEEMVPGCPADVLPLYKPESDFKELAKINVPMLVLFGDHNEANIHEIKVDLATIKAKAKASPNVTTTIIKGANHTYDNKEQQLAKVILKWTKNL